VKRSQIIPDCLKCPLCADLSPHFHADERRDYYRCSICALVFVPPWQHLDYAAQKAQYDQHQNRPDDPSYRRFLSRLFDPLVGKLPPGASGLDFGSGPGPTLSLMFEELGFPMQIYDPLYAPDMTVFEERYDFITSTEVFEHLAHPDQELRRLLALLKPSGWLGLMTKRVDNHAAFTRWHYIQDPTHISFFSEATFAFISARHRLELEFPRADTVLVRKAG
jgi:SAM-dependent methyltransferase